MKSTIKYCLTTFVGLALAACSGDSQTTDPTDPTDPNNPTQLGSSTVGNEETTFDHNNDADLDPFELLEKLQQEGPPEFRARLHSCPKIKYSTLGNLLDSLGVNTANATAGSAGFLYQNADQALGVANYGARIPETFQLTTASATKLYDIFIAAAPEIIANMPSRTECEVGGAGTEMFNAQGQCTVNGVSCLIGQPATLRHMELCNQVIQSASSPEKGRVIAVAALASAAHTCE